MRRVSVLFSLLLLSAAYASSATAQIKETSPAKQRAANRRSLRDASRYPAEYKDSHLAVGHADLRRGEGGQAGQPEDGRASYKFDQTGTARVSEPTYPALRLRKKEKKKE